MTCSLADHFRAMARNNAWSNARLLDACVRLSDEEFTAERVSFFPSLQQTLNHILLVDRNYLADLVGTGRAALQEYEPLLRAADLAVAQTVKDHQLVAFCDTVTEADLDRIIPIDRSEGVAYRETVSAVLTHLFVHQIHHRGQAHAMLSGTGVAPPQLDEFFLASDTPRRNIELRRLGLSAC